MRVQRREGVGGVEVPAQDVHRQALDQRQQAGGGGLRVERAGRGPDLREDLSETV